MAQRRDLLGGASRRRAEDNGTKIEHRLSEGGTRYETVWTLEPAADADWMVVGESLLNQGVLAY